MQHLALSFRKKYHLKNVVLKDIEQFEIIYLRACEFNSYEEIISEIDGILNNIKNSGKTEHYQRPHFSIFIDGLDEMQSFYSGNNENESAENNPEKKIWVSLNNFFDSLSRYLRNNTAKKIFVSMRPEVFKGGRDQLIMFVKHHNNCYLINPKNMDKKRAVLIYEKSGKRENDPKQTISDTVRKIEEDFDSACEKKEESVFAFPFIAEHASAIVSKSGIDRKSRYEVQNAIVDYDLKREEGIRHDLMIRRFAESGGDVMPDDEVRIANEYLISANKSLDVIAGAMETNRITVEKLMEAISGYNRDKPEDEQIIIEEDELRARRMMRFVSRKGGSDEYEFIHNLIYIFLKCRADLANPETIKTRFSELDSVSDTSGKMFLEGFFTHYGKYLDYKNASGFVNDFINEKRVRFRYSGDPDALTVERFSGLIFGASGSRSPIRLEIVYNDDVIELSDKELTGFVKERTLDLSGKNIHDASIINAFDLDLYDETDLSGNEIERFDIDREFDSVDLSKNPIKPENIVSRIKNLTVSVETGNDVDGFNTSGIESIGFILPDVEFSPLYKKVWDMRRSGKNVRTLNRMRVFDNYYDHPGGQPRDILEAAYELDSLNIAEANLAASGDHVTKSVISYCIICRMYAESIGTENPELRESVESRITETIAESLSVRDLEYDPKADKTRLTEIFNVKCIRDSEAHRAENKGDVAAAMFLSFYYEKTGDDDSRFRYDTIAAESGDAIAMCRLGRCYHYGTGTSEDSEKAFFWFKKSAEKGDPRGMDWLGWCYKNGRGTDRDPEKAFEWYMKSAENGYPHAMCNMGRCYECGTGTQQNSYKAFEWYEKSAENGDSDGMKQLGICYYYEIGTDKDYYKSLYWINKSAENGNSTGMYWLGRCYENGKGTEPDKGKALEWYEKSAENGNAEGMHYYGRCFYYGTGTDINIEKAFEWFGKSAEKNDNSGMYWLGWCYENGKGTEPDPEKALELYLKSAEKDNSGAARRAAILLEEGKGTANGPDIEKAKELYRKSAEIVYDFDLRMRLVPYYILRDNTKKPEEAFGYFSDRQGEDKNGEFLFCLGYCYENAYGTEGDIEKAFDCYFRSAEKGNKYGMFRLALLYEDEASSHHDPGKAFEWFKKSANELNKEYIVS